MHDARRRRDEGAVVGAGLGLVAFYQREAEVHRRRDGILAARRVRLLVRRQLDGVARVRLDDHGLAGAKRGGEPAKGAGLEVLREEAADCEFYKIFEKVSYGHPKHARVLVIHGKEFLGAKRPRVRILAPVAFPQRDAVWVAELDEVVAVVLADVQQAVGVARLQAEGPHLGFEFWVVPRNERRRAKGKARLLERVELREALHLRLVAAAGELCIKGFFQRLYPLGLVRRLGAFAAQQKCRRGRGSARVLAH
mmetsp:Transcript_10562/g.35009  ORF Transcript_10562/g.35009 Transcript_10562/m.35009 type:complete len:252 (-) Transcript_10562:814-1569(-)